MTDSELIEELSIETLERVRDGSCGLIWSRPHAMGRRMAGELLALRALGTEYRKRIEELEREVAALKARMPQ